LVTGDKKNRDELDQVAERIFNMHRAITIRDMGTKEMRTRHDIIPPWVFGDAQGRPSLTKGTIHMDKEDIAKAMDLYYEEMGWDKTTGAPTASTYRKLGLAGVGDELKKKGLVP
jgi:aldehyde:ferredoxin oxidoreductase